MIYTKETIPEEYKFIFDITLYKKLYTKNIFLKFNIEKVQINKKNILFVKGTNWNPDAKSITVPFRLNDNKITVNNPYFLNLTEWVINQYHYYQNTVDEKNFMKIYNQQKMKYPEYFL